ncbi:hypothetical protein FS749_011725 [Ceratobasidium sp. UAMH 11750]|nr:hypothetical protein FS749_011725 [Ceratobasidium sp. UAMH 11750]
MIHHPVSLFLAYVSDRYKIRGLILFVTGVIATAGFAIYLGMSAGCPCCARPLTSSVVHTDKNVLYGSLFLQIVGVYASAPTLSAWMTNNVQPYYRRATAIALAFVTCNIGGIVSTWIFTDPPRYTVATRLNFAFAVGVCVFAAIVDLYLIDQNRQKANVLASPDYGKNGEDSLEEQKRLGDKHPKFKYIL